MDFSTTSSDKGIMVFICL